MTTNKILLDIIKEARQKQFTRLDFSGNHIDTLPSELFELAHLETLNLNNNGLSILPDAIGRLKSLKKLTLSRNKLTALPDVIGDLKNLLWINLDDNQLTELPDAIGGLCNLKRLSLRRNHLKCITPAIGRLAQLMVLNLESNQLSEVQPAIGQLQNLKTIQLSNNQIKELPIEMSGLVNLSRLSLQYNQLSVLPGEIGRLKELVWLYVQNNRLTSLPPEIGQLRYLETLNVSNNQLTTLPAELSLIGNLTKLYFAGNRIKTLPTEIIHFRKFYGLKDSSKTPETSQDDPVMPDDCQSPPPELTANTVRYLESAIKILPRGNIRTNILSTMQMNTPANMSTSVTRDLSHDARRLNQLLVDKGYPPMDDLDIRAQAKAHINGSNFEINSLSPAEQPVSQGKFARWDWIVTPLVSGDQTLQLKIDMNIKTSTFNSALASHIETFSIKVTSIPFEALRQFIYRRYPWILAALLALVTISAGLFYFLR